LCCFVQRASSGQIFEFACRIIVSYSNNCSNNLDEVDLSNDVILSEPVVVFLFLAHLADM
jgi:hypothetical protein